MAARHLIPDEVGVMFGVGSKGPLLTETALPQALNLVSFDGQLRTFRRQHILGVARGGR